MSTILYLESTTNPNTPTNLGAPWFNTSQIGRFVAKPVKSGSTMTTHHVSDASVAEGYMAVGQWNSPPLTAGQAINNGLGVTLIARMSEAASSGNLIMLWAIYIYDTAGTTIRRTLIIFRIDDSELAVGTLTSRYGTTTFSGANYVTQAGDRLSIEVGFYGDPDAGGSHTGDMSIGSDSATDLSASGETSAFNPVVIIDTNLTFESMPSASQSISPSSSPSIASSSSVSNSISISPSASVSRSPSPSVSLSFSPSSSQSPSSSISPSLSPSHSFSPSSSVSPSVSPSVAPTTIFYLESTTYAPATPTPIGWTDTSQLGRYLTDTTKASSVMTTLNITDSSLTQEDIIRGQWFSHSLTPGQTVTGSQVIGLIIRASETSANNNLHLSWGVYVYNQNTLKKTVVAKRNSIYEVSSGGLASIEDEAVSSTGDYTTVAEDRLVFEIGLEGDPISGGSHTGSISVGSDSALDLSTSGISAPNNPIITFDTDSFTFTTLSNSASLSKSPSISLSTSPSFSTSPSYSYSSSKSASSSPSRSESISPSSSLSISKSSSVSNSASSSRSRSSSISKSPSISQSKSVSPSISKSISPSSSQSPSASFSPSISESLSLSRSESISKSPSSSFSPSSSVSNSPSPSSTIPQTFRIFIQAG